MNKIVVGIFVLICSISFSRAQTTAIPDTLFEKALINLGLDSLQDGTILTASIDTLTRLNVSNKGIASLTGIEDFSNLTHLTCWSNNLTNINLTQNTSITYLHICCNSLTQLDVSQNTLLRYLRCDNNSIDSLDVTKNTLLTSLNCGSNNLSELDVSKNIMLNQLWCRFNNLSNLDVGKNLLLRDLSVDNNQLSTLDLSNHLSLVLLLCNNNQLTALNVKNGNNRNFTMAYPPMMQNPHYVFFAENNPLLQCIEVDDSAWSSSNWPNIDGQTLFKTNCNFPSTVTEIENSLEQIKIYPIPSNQKVTVSLGNLQLKGNITLINNLGEVLYFKKMLFSETFTLELNYPKGIYFIKIEQEEGLSKVFKIVKE